MPKPKILVQLDTDAQPSVFDAVVALDAGVEYLLSHHGVTPATVVPRVHGAIFTRGVDDLKRTALFIGGSDVAAGDAVLSEVKKAFFGPMRTSVMLDSGGCNTTAAAAVLAISRHVPLAGASVLVLAATGPVGQRAVRLLAREKAIVRVGSRKLDRAQEVCDAVAQRVTDARLTPHVTETPADLAAALDGVQAVVAAGAAGVRLLPLDARRSAKSLAAAVDLNAVPPAGIEGIEVTDKGVERDGVVCYGAIGVGGTKMKIHKAALARLFEANNLALDAEEIYEIGRGM